MSSRSRIFATALAASITGSVVAMIVTPADAQYRIRPEEWQYETKRPQRGYEGFPAPGVYCSYRREPNRVCTYDKRGRERCRITSWRLIQFCS